LQMHAFSAALTCLLGVLALFAVVAILKRGITVNRSLIGLLGVTAFAGLLLTRLAAMGFLAYYTQKGYDRHYVVIGGAQGEGLALAETLEGERGGVFQVRGFVSEDPADSGREVGRWKVLGGFQDLPAIIGKMPVDEVYLLPTAGPLESSLD